MLQRGEDVKVVDAATGEDITRLILTQIIVEDAKTTGSNFPMDVLRQMVIATGKAGQEGTLKYMKSILDFYQDTYRVMAPPVNPFDFMSGQTSERTGGSASSRTAATDQATGDSRTQPVAATDAVEVMEMKRRLAELEEVVSRIAPKPAARKNKARKARS
jgi:hypothetical protein